MLFGHHSIDKTVDEHVRDIANLANDSQTLIFLDTNILSYLYKLHEAARREFFAWSDAVLAANRMVVPAWAANEYLARVTSKTLDSYTPKSKEANQATKILDGLFETASLFVDETSLKRIGYSKDRATFITGFRAAIDALAPFTRVFSQDFDSGVIHQQIEAHLSPAILDSDLAALCVRATQEGAGRFEHRLPPGFRDADKLENRLGDLIIWFEILEKSASSAKTFPKVLFISRDEKNDWVYAPKMRMELVQGDRKAVGNSRPEIKLADPRLVTEFRRATGHTNITIASIDTLVEGLSKANSALFAHLAAAIQINIEQLASVLPPANEPEAPINGQPEEAAADAALPPVKAQPEPVDPTAPRLVYEQEALRDREYQADAPTAINEIIRDLQSLNWYTQNPAITRIRAIRQDEFPPSSWFVLGRNIYQTACGNSQKAMEFMAGLESQLRQFPQDTAQHLLAGMLFEVYFNSRGEFRDEVKFSYADKPLSVATNAEFADVLEFINYYLRNQGDRLTFMPGDQARKLIHVVAAPLPIPATDASQTFEGLPFPPTHEIRSVLFDGVELLHESEPKKPNIWSRMLRTAKISPEHIRDQISDELAIPKWAFTIETDPPISTDIDLVMPKGFEIQPRLALQSP
ncbi:PIN-like domain-containing protein [Chitinolyticbacter albus]|uniref:PIN-like domain-containing protein n=1 Tax=Chitinolyticbacter albus TaxID=2961951 RepID=UPI00210EEDB9|nr:PIN-like domain-containing protein [Chitinolyticbacter albus]